MCHLGGPARQVLAPMSPPVSWFERPGRAALVAVVLFGPVAVASAALAAAWGASFLDCAPVWNDEVHYWNEIACFARAGFHGGYCVPDERPAPAGWARFGPHGPGFPVAYGAPAALVGWQPASAPFFNATAWSLAAAFWLWRCRPDTPRLAVAALFTATFWPCALYLPSTMQECLHYALAFVLAALIHPWANGPGRGPAALGAVVLVVAAAAFVRVTWALVLIPLASVALGGLPRRQKVIGWTVALLGIPALVAVWHETCAPFQNFPARLADWAQAVPKYSAYMIRAKLNTSLIQFFSPDAGDFTLDVALRFLVIGVFLLGAFAVLLAKPEARRPYLFSSLNLAGVAAVVITFYDIDGWRGTRVFAPHLLLSLLVLLSGAAYRWVLGVAAVQLALALPFWTAFTGVHKERLQPDAAALAAMRQAVAGHVVFDPAASAWENTVLARTEYLKRPLLELPPGVGVSWVTDMMGSDLKLPPKSRYLLANAGHVRLMRSRNVRLQRLAGTPLGDLYLNLDSFPGGPPAGDGRLIVPQPARRE